MPNAASTSPEAWRNFGTKLPIAAFWMKRDGLKRLYQLINERQKEYRDKILLALTKLPEESDTDFDTRKTRVTNAFVTSVTITAETGEIITGNNEDIFHEAFLPTAIKYVLYSTSSVPNAVLNHLPEDRIVVFLDFSRPPLMDFGRLPTLATPNESNLTIDSRNESWFAATKLKLGNFFEERKTGHDWLHRAAVYDILLFTVGVPIGLWASYRINILFPGINNFGAFLKNSALVYAFFISLIFFRIMFSYSRWVFPKIEIETDSTRTPTRHRILWTAIILSVIGTALYDAAKFLLK